jgi:histidinol dehydrogenase|tara:strand:- start:39640 stop:40926 length:1287 start_codon:yes stop_codon:yes gene_type:complete
MKITILSQSKISNEIKKIRKSQEEDFVKVNKIVSNIIKSIRKDGDRALLSYTKKFDKIELTLKELKLNKEIIKNSESQLPAALKKAMKLAIKRVKDYQKRKLTKPYRYKDNYGNQLGWNVTPIERVGIYVPGGTASYPSSLIMTATLAKVAGVNEIIICTPPSKYGISDSILYVANLLNIDEIYQVGGAQGIAAMAYGTKAIKKVNKIVGPGNIFVAAAKKQVFGDVGIDMVAGPSEVLIVSDSKSNPTLIACDLLAQAEHDSKASAILVTNSRKIANQVLSEVKRLTKNSRRKNIIEKSIKKNGRIYIMSSIKDCIEFSNNFAPEHLEIFLNKFSDYKDQFKNAGSIFIGENSAEAFGDYIAGPSHVLPTNGNAMFSSPLSSLDFIKYTSFTSISERGMRALSNDVEIIAESEGLFEHSNSIKARKA